MGRSSYLWGRWIYLRLFAIGFLASFFSILIQIQGLIGPRGILPAQEYLNLVTAQEPSGLRFLLAPSLLWLNAGPVALNLLCWGGLIASVLILVNFWPRMSLFLSWLFYLSYVSVARNFSGFQFDDFMLENALLGVFLAPRGLRPGLGEKAPASRAALFMVQWILFRLMFESGLVKILSGDLSWRHFTAMDDYYENCPFPTVLGWFTQQLPHLFHALSVGGTFFSELISPLMIFLGQRPRKIAFFSIVLMQIGIALTASYAFLNVGTIALCFLLLEDETLRRLLPLQVPDSPSAPKPAQRWRRIGAGSFFTIHCYVTGMWLLATMGFPLGKLPLLTLQPLALAQPFRSANHYGLFAVMTHERNEIEFEGSSDGGTSWKRYEFKWQPQKLNVPPGFMAPHLARFDWNLWFAVLGPWREYPFVLRTGARLIEGEQAVAALFSKNPFPEKPPSMIRFPRVRYRFTNLATLRATGNYWSREPAGSYAPMILKDPADGRIKLSEPAKEP